MKRGRRGGARALASVFTAASLALAAPAAAAPVRFIATGDFGEGNHGQYRVAKAMEFVCDDPQHGRGCDFVLGLGDNIYDIGVANTSDQQFQTKFELPYAALARTWYMTLGNHDNSHDPVINSAVGDAIATVAEEIRGVGAGHWYEAGNREVAYTAVDAETPDGSEWYMPARFYDFTKSEGDVEFFALDTNTLMYMGVPFPPIAATIEEQISAVVERQEIWIRKELADSTATWKIVFGHHPYRSNGEHGNAGFYEGAPMTPISGPYVKLFYEQFVCGKADLLIVGHDHDLQFLRPLQSCGAMPFIVSGAGAKTRHFATHGEGQYVLAEENRDPYWARDDTLGFFWLEIEGAKLRVVTYLVHEPTYDPAEAADPAPDHLISGVPVRNGDGDVHTETIQMRKAYDRCFEKGAGGLTELPSC